MGQFQACRIRIFDDERIRTNPGEFGQKRTNPNPGEFGRNRVKNGRIWAKNGQQWAKNGRTKPNPGKTGRNRKFRRNFIRIRASLIRTGHILIPPKCNFGSSLIDTAM